MIVVDANVIAYLLIEGDHTRLARAVHRADPDWRLPPLWRHEYLNILATTARVGRVRLEQLLALWNEALALFSAAESDVGMEKALALATKHGVSAYDAQYVALAEQLAVHLVTQDRKLRRAFPARVVSMQGFCDAHGSKPSTLLSPPRD